MSLSLPVPNEISFHCPHALMGEGIEHYPALHCALLKTAKRYVRINSESGADSLRECLGEKPVSKFTV